MKTRTARSGSAVTTAVWPDSKTENLPRYNAKTGLPNDGAFQILEDENRNFWISSNRGIYRVSHDELNDFADGKIATPQRRRLRQIRRNAQRRMQRRTFARRNSRPRRKIMVSDAGRRGGDRTGNDQNKSETAAGRHRNNQN